MHRINWVLENVSRRKERPMVRGFCRDPSNEKRHTYRSSVNMADELIQQAQELLEGHIVGCCPVPGLCFED